MNFGEKLKRARNEAHLTQEELAHKLGIAKSTVAGYENNSREPDVMKIKKITEILNINADYLLGVEKVPHFSPDEKAIIEKYRVLDSHGKNIVNANLNIEFDRVIEEQRKQKELLKAQETAKKKAAKKIVEMPEQKTWVLPSYDISASAGTGTIFDESECTPMVLKSEPPYGAAFVIPITGDSMTPKFHDGDYVFVRPQPTIEIGQIGIFYHDGGSYIKQLGNGELVSLNPEHPNIKIDEYTHCFGRVLGVYKPDSDVENEEDYEYYRIARSTTKPGETEKLTKNVLDNLEQKTKNGDFKRDYKF